MTWAQLLVACLTLSAKASLKLIMLIFFVICTLFRFGYYLMTPERDEQEMEQAALPMPESTTHHYGSPNWPPVQHHRPCNYDVFGVRIPAADDTPPLTPQSTHEPETGMLLEHSICAYHNGNHEILATNVWFIGKYCCSRG
ncbi:unnamed protein product [Gongylonema pulchrum]|uniref:Secreted protein n=1 Tax=Gongylonema pulchrum TaxID=637853 RepID=A0A183DKF7_9BILA|nr:unnamed protein product [Gongylonema pulchrum]